ncbi:hypothetical protein IM660_17140 [Ruania alkalisoli]|uniref:Fido domain-containing protein n=1 Tax=Ruania alkalisoli TaxID=2779775 RepID=A0A7M1SU57_9MICO|nr:hypothetical protein [Ruania alkalisoli]QOR70302.1 hypothetical protein IM660_17140 [Ruania alkalisoli]
MDGNKRLALAGSIAFPGMYGSRPILSNSEAYELIMNVSAGELDDVALVAEQIRAATRSW